MPKIVITEKDLTSPGVIDESTDVVYIPGFVNINPDYNPDLWTTNSETGEQEYIGIKVNEPTLFTSLSEFQSLCGNEPAYFSEDQLYSSLSGIEADGSITGFSNDAVPYHGVMFNQGQADPSYVMAKEILSAGLCVLYERVNNDDYSVTYNKEAEAPADWNENYQNYEVSHQVYESIISASAPEMFTKQNGFEYLNAGVTDNSALITYYTRTAVTDPEDNVLTIGFVPVSNDDVVTTLVDGKEMVATEGLVQNDGTTVPAYYVQNSDLVESEDELVKYYLTSQIQFSGYTPIYEPGKYYMNVGSASAPQYVQLNSSTAPADWGVGTYFEDKGSSGTPDYQQVTFSIIWSPEFVANQYYKADYTLVESPEEPEDWATAQGKYFERTGEEGNYQYTEVPDGTPYVASTFYEKTYSAVSVKPEDWGTGEYYSRSGEPDSYVYTQIQFVNGFEPSFSSVEGTVITVSEDNSSIFVPVTEQPDNWGAAAFYVLGTEVTPKDLPQQPGDNTFVKGTKYIPHSWIVGFRQGVMTSYQYEPVQGINVGNGEVAPTWNPQEIYRYVSDGIDIKTMYDALQSIYAITDSGLSDKGNYSIKYLTSGGYPTYEYSQNALVTQMMNLCVERGDCVAFIDHTDNPYRNQNIDQVGSLYYAVKNDLTFQTSGEFATMFTPWATYNRTTTDLDNQMRTADGYKSNVRMPASFAYFLSLGDSIEVNPNWLAIAGVARGLVQNLSLGGMTTNIPNGAADAMEPRDGIAINPITNIKPYGYTIWGNRTLKNNATAGNLTATSFLNIRNLVSDIKKEVYRTARKLTFEQNNDVLWVNFKAEVSPLLDRMLHGYGISSYQMQIDTKHPRYGERATLCVKIIISPIEPVEDFYVSIIMQDDEDATITES